MPDTIHFAVGISADQANEFARRLATDDAFRQSLEGNPEGTLESLGIHIPPGQIKRPVQLPGKDQLVAAVHAAGGEFEPNVGPVFICFLAFLAFL